MFKIDSIDIVADGGLITSNVNIVSYEYSEKEITAIQNLMMNNKSVTIKEEDIMWEEITFKYDDKSWNFKSSSDADVNWKDIKNSLTYADPLALVTRKFRDYETAVKYVVVGKQLMDKAHTAGWIEDMPFSIDTIEKRVFEIGNNFSEWVEWARAVKEASWPDPVKSEFQVILPKI